MIELAKKGVPSATFRKMDIADLKFQENSFDGVWASASLLHLPKNRINKVLNKIFDILTEKGVLYISLKEGSGEKNIQDYRYGGVEKFYSYYELDEIKSLLEGTGFDILKSYLVDMRKNYDTNSWIHIICKK